MIIVSDIGYEDLYLLGSDSSVHFSVFEKNKFYLSKFLVENDAIFLCEDIRHGVVAKYVSYCACFIVWKKT